MRIKRVVFAVAAMGVAIALLAAGLELVASAFLYVREGTYVPARARFASKSNTFITDLSTRDCGYVDSLYPHPYLGFVHHANPPCGIATNNIGLFGPDFPSSRPDDRFVIMVTGGSVASWFARPLGKGPAFLEQLLNSRYVSPTGKSFLVLDGGDGAWKQPQQAILSLLYVDTVHAIVTLDGFNEHYMLQSARRFEFPANNFLTVNPLASQHFRDVVMRWTVGRVGSMASNNAILSRSNAAYELIDMFERWAERRASARARPKTSIDTLFALAEDLTPDELRAWQIKQYQKYVRAITGLAREHGVLSAHFIQPVPAIDKELTPDERKVVGDLGYRDDYLTMTNGLLALNQAGIPVVSMLTVFKGDARTLYEDPIHLIRDTKTGRSPGYERMAEQMAQDLARLWHLRPRDQVGGVTKSSRASGDLRVASTSP